MDNIKNVDLYDKIVACWFAALGLPNTEIKKCNPHACT